MTMKPKAKKFRIRRSPAAGSAQAATVEQQGETNPSRPPEVERLRPRVVTENDTARRPEADPTAGDAAAQTAAVDQPATPEAPAASATDASAPAEPAVADTGTTAGTTAETTAGTIDDDTARSQAADTTDTARSGMVSSAHEMSVEAEIDAIRREGLTGRQLRMARRVAQKHSLPATSDFDAVRLLRQQGIDPFHRSNMLELVVPRDDSDAPKDKVQLPQTIPAGTTTLPSTDLSPAQQREREITEIQRDIVSRRRKKMLLLLTRLFFFVMIPTAVVGWYFYSVATPMYATKSEFLILKADNAGGGTGLGNLLSGTQFATSQDSIAVQSYLESKDAMLRLDADQGFKAHFSQPWIDPIQRLPADPTNEQAYKIYSKDVKIGYDPTEGVVRMQVIAADPETSANFARSLLSYAEERVNHLSEQKRSDQMRDALAGFENAQIERRKAQEALVTLQQKGAILDPEGVIAALRGQINNIEIQLQDKQLELSALMDNPRPNQAKVEGAKGDVRRLQELLDQLNKKMVDASKGENSLAELSVRIQMAQADLTTRDMMLQSSLQQVEQTRMEANRQVRYLTTSVEPVASQDPAYPRKFENTILAFLLFSGIYLMISLTASILREQITS